MTALIFLFAAAIASVAAKNSMFTTFLAQQNSVSYAPAEMAANPTTICNDQLLNYCHIKFNEYLGITTADWRDFDLFVKDIQTILNRGVDNGLLRLCSARTLYYSCLAASYSDCMSKFHFLRQGYTLDQAMEYVEIFAQLEFMCSGGLLQTVGNWDCIWGTLAVKSDEFDACYATYSASNQTCSDSAKLLLCLRVPLYTSCGPDASWWECEITRVALEIANYCPQLSCNYDLTQQSLASRAMKRFDLFRHPNPYFMPKHKQELFAQLAAKATERAKRKKRSVE